MNVNSNNIRIFPVAKIRNDQGSRLFYEHNIANMTRQLMDTTGFVIQEPQISITQSNELKIKNLIFNIYGYYIEISEVIVPIENNGREKIYAELKLTTDTIYSEINGQDKDSLYEGLDIRVTTNDLDHKTLSDGKPNVVRLKLLTSHSDSGTIIWTVPVESLQKFDGSKIISGIDGKV